MFSTIPLGKTYVRCRVGWVVGCGSPSHAHPAALFRRPPWLTTHYPRIKPL